ncbi:hypothetical protein FA95DRAFT_421787 [Auriscalpium vulgare]|uniref:Uncharacterized protein n=1 Tax=Auriscalpium vulgare TaxID=40419 RepID=A0ACB8S4G1_9AGAM|nr:hypothetical protein FA95DRAFT_421787 [Auriscalpium vulgare]
MAQPLFDDHPLEAYLQSGEDIEHMPGAMTTPAGADHVLLDEDEIEAAPPTEYWRWLPNWRWLPTPIAYALNSLHTTLSSAKHLGSSEKELSERFKYDVISSSLLSSSINATQSDRRRSFPLPGDEVDSDLDPGQPNDRSTSSPTPHHPVFASPILLSLTLISLLSGSILLFIIFGTALYLFLSHNPGDSHKPNVMIPTLDALNELIAAGDNWDSIVHEAISTLEREEKHVSHLASPASPTSPVRVALHSSLHTTQSQADNVRHLLAALTSPSSLGHLSEMYAPSSPIKPNFQLGAADRPRSVSPSSVAVRPRTTSAPSHADKHMTWSGTNSLTYGALARGSSSTSQPLKRDRRRSDLLTLLLKPASQSAPPTPRATPLAGVQEEKVDYLDKQSDEEDSDGEGQLLVPLGERSAFASAAFDLQRKRRSSGMEAFGMTPSPPPNYTYANKRSSRPYGHSPTPSTITLSSPRSSYSSGRFTSMQSNRHPLSLSALHHAVQGAVAAKRYAASHLLALRFDDFETEDGGEEADTYWEDVRSVMALLTSTLADSAARLADALDVAEGQRLREQNPTPSPISTISRSNSPTSDTPNGAERPRRHSHLRTVSQMTSFAPMPSQFSRFAEHVDAMSSALNDARDHLEECVASLRDGTPSSTVRPEESPAVQAYERLRRELGLALRECERGRERLLDLVAPRPADNDDDDDDDVPALGPDGESDDSDAPSRQHPSPASPDPAPAPLAADAVLVHGAPGADDATLQLLLSTSTQHLPPQGAEQVFEAEPGPPKPFARSRSKLSREERIRLARARRESGRGVGLGLSMGQEEESAAGGVERWGPGGDVVQELKDVIWKVGEKRRLLGERRTSTGDESSGGPDGVLGA